MIVLGYEKLDQNQIGWNFNGRYNHVYDTQTINFPNQFYTDVYNTIINPTDQTYCQDIFPHLHIYNRQRIQVVKQPICDIKEKYLYPIQIKNIRFYCQHIKKILLSSAVIDDVKNKKAKIVFIYDIEGDLYNFLQTFIPLIIDLDLPKKQIYVIHADYQIDKFNDLPFQYRISDPFLWWVPFPDKDEKVEIEKTFLCYNRTVRPHKALLMSLLKTNNLLDYGIFSLGKLDNLLDVRKSTILNQSDLDILTSLQNSSLDVKNFDLENPAGTVNLEHIKKTFLSLVTETLAQSDVLFLSEKIYKPLAFKHPFIVFGNPGTVSLLKTKGYQTFDNFWDESYDNEIDLQSRANKIVKIIIDLVKLNSDDLIKLRQSMIPILDHNYNVFLKYRQINSCFNREADLYTTLEKIYNE